MSIQCTYFSLPQSSLEGYSCSISIILQQASDDLTIQITSRLPASLTLWNDVISNSHTTQHHVSYVEIWVHLQLRDHCRHVHEGLRIHSEGFVERMHQRKKASTKIQDRMPSARTGFCKWTKRWNLFLG